MTIFYFKDEPAVTLESLKDCAFYSLLINIDGEPTQLSVIYAWRLNVIRMVKNDQGWVDFRADLIGASREPHVNIIEDRVRAALIDLSIFMDQQTKEEEAHA